MYNESGNVSYLIGHKHVTNGRYGAHQGIDIDTLPYPKAYCISGMIDNACDVA